jgi:hypothetical protein
VLFYQCDDFTSTTKHFEENGTLLGVCIKDSMNRDCGDNNAVFESFTLANSIITIWSCDEGFDCDNAPRSLLFKDYDIIIRNDLCEPSLKVLLPSEIFDGYQWTDPAGMTSIQREFMTTQSGRHKLIVFNDLGCADSSFIDVNTSEKIPLKIFGNTSICNDQGVELSLDEFSKYIWSTGDSTKTITVNTPGLFYVEVANDSGCSDTASIVIDDARNQRIKILPSEEEIFAGQIIELRLEYSNLRFDQLSELIWIYNEQTILNQEFLSLKIENTTLIEVTAVGPTNCMLQDQIRIEPLPFNKEVYIPNAFNPMSRIGNSHFYVQSIGGTISLKRLSIFNRWGSKILENHSPTINDKLSGWDGQVEGQLQSPGVYVYIVELEYANGESEIITGTVTLLY